jgi:flagellar basal-body rod protein FlgB
MSDFARWHQRCFPGPKTMIEALFNQPNYLAAKKTLDAVALRQEAINNNLANLETPGYKRVNLAPNFEQELEKATASNDPQQISSLSPSLAVDTAATSSSKDGNTVHLEQELMRMNQNAVTHSLETQVVSTMLSKMRLAIMGQ